MIVCVCLSLCVYIYACMSVCIYMCYDRGYGTIQHIDPYLYQNRICRLQTAPSENTHTYIQTNSSHTYNIMLSLYLNLFPNYSYCRDHNRG